MPPNEITPRDGITPWLAGGRPVWNPLTRQVTFLDPNVTATPYRTTDTQVIVANGANFTLTGDAILTDWRSPRFVPGLGFGSYTRPTKFINPDGSYFWSQGHASVFNIYNLTAAQVSAVATADPGHFDIFQRRYSNSALTPAPAAWDVVGASVYVPASVTNQRLYHWDKVNVSAANYGELRNGTYNLEVEQQLLPNLYFSAGWFRQDLDTLENDPISQLATTTVSVDTNTHLPDGRVNPNFQRVFVDAQDPDTAETPELNETFRAMLAYDLDFTKSAGWARWLGRHRLLGFASRVENQYTQIRARYAFTDPSDPRFLTPLTAFGLHTARAAGYRYAGNSSTSRQIYYVGDNGAVGYGPSTTSPSRRSVAPRSRRSRLTTIPAASGSRRTSPPGRHQYFRCA